VNNFDDTIPDNLVPEREGKCAIDACAVSKELRHAVGWYRKESAEKLSPKKMRTEADEIYALLLQLNEKMEIAGGMDPLLRALVLDNMRHLGIHMPEFARIAGCVMNAKGQLPPVTPGAAGKRERDRAARTVYAALRNNSTPPLGKVAARKLGADLLRKCRVPMPVDDKELRVIMGE